MLEWLSDSRSTIAAVIILGLLAAFFWSIVIGRKRTRETAKDAVFGDPEQGCHFVRLGEVLEDGHGGEAVGLILAPHLHHRNVAGPAGPAVALEEEARAGEAMGLMHRTSQQFHWQNHDYADFDAFLSSLSSRKRKMIRRERAEA